MESLNKVEPGLTQYLLVLGPNSVPAMEFSLIKIWNLESILPADFTQGCTNGSETFTYIKQLIL